METQHVDPSMPEVALSLEDAGPRTITMITTRLDTRRDLADSGATISATGIKSILHRFQEESDYEIKGYDGQITKAAGQGYAKIYNPATKRTDEMLFVYTPTISGTIISLEHHAKTHPGIHKWAQEATPSDDRGMITFFAEDGAVVSAYPTMRSQGLYYIQDLHFIPATPMAQDERHPAPPETIDAQHQPLATGRINMIHTTLPDDSHRTAMMDSDYTPDIETDHYRQQLQAQDTPVRTISTAMVPLPDRMAHAVHQYELWHQRLGHAPLDRLLRTSKHVQGLPHLPPGHIPSFVKCRACDIAKLKKAPRGHPTPDQPDLQTGQNFHMDLGFIRGPANLQAVVDREEEAQPKIIHSRQGYTCYLLIIDRKSRYMWVFPLKSRSVSIDLMDSFLAIHGNHQVQPRLIRTDGEGSLAESEEFRALLVKHKYLLQKTATDTSSQNGMVERPHQSLGAMVRCLLYASALPVQFWADALVYAIYITNRLYHAGIQDVPYNVWTGRQANVSHLRMFGAHVTVRRSGFRPTKLDPHFYTGRFLRFGATAKNIVYYDERTKREKVARHCTMDELHYTSPVSKRPPMMHEIIQRVLPDQPPAISNDENVLMAVPDPGLHLRALDKLDPATTEHRQREPQVAMAATMYNQLTQVAQQAEAILAMAFSLTSYGPPITVDLPMNQLPTLGIILRDAPSQHNTTIQGCQEGTAASRLPRWRSQLQAATVRLVGDTPIRTRNDFIGAVATLRQRRATRVHIIVARHEIPLTHTLEIPQLHYDQLKHVNTIQNRMRAQRTAKHKGEQIYMLMTAQATIMLTRSQLKRREDYQQWRSAEWTQHNKYRAQKMFGTPIKRPPGATVLPFVWAYYMKEDPITGEPIYKARGTCNGGKRYGKAITLAETYATCVAQPACRLYWAITANEGLISLGADAGNAFAEAPPPIEPFYMVIDDQFHEWWVECLGNPPIPPGHVLPVQHALQGHPESPRLWETHIHTILVDRLHFVPTTHEKCLYSKRDSKGNLQLLLRQVDDFSVAAKEAHLCEATIAAIGKYLQVPLNDLGLIKKFNGVNILQTRWYIKVSCQDYITRILTDHAWLNLKAANLPVPMRSDPGYQRQLETATRPTDETAQNVLQTQAGFSYRMTTGELIYALVAARPDISFATTKLTQYGSNPALIHYQAVKTVYAFLNNTKEDGLIYWRPAPYMDLPDVPFPSLRSSRQDILPSPKMFPRAPLAYSDSDWGSDSSHRRSVTGIIIMVAGAAVVYKTHYQRAVALSSTEAEFVSASDAGKVALYIRSLLHDLGFAQDHPTPLRIDNKGALHMVTAGAPTKRTRHVDIRYFALLEWADTGQLKAESVPTAHNISDSMTKATGRVKFHQHADLYMGRQPPRYVPPPLPVQEQRATIATLLSPLFPAGVGSRFHAPDMQEVSALHFPDLHHALHHVVHPTRTEHGRVKGLQ